MLEAAKEICKNNGKLSKAQVLLLDFAKAYDSLDRTFLNDMLRAKGFPPRFCQIVQATHCNTTIRFKVNGRLSKKNGMTRGIRQGFPLAPLLFIIAVDLIYGVIESESRLAGIPLTSESDASEIKIAGFADDTAIYLEDSEMQTAAIAAVKEFSAVSGPQLNVKKSVAIHLGGEAEDTDNDVDAEDREERSAPDRPAVERVQSTRHLGHIAGEGGTTKEAWERAFAALRIRLALAEVKTNTAQQRADIAAAIIVPKLLYVARHAWPTEENIKHADLAIRNFVWKSIFKVPERAAAGWVQAPIAEQSRANGGLRVPNIRTELTAMSAMVVGNWALTQRRQVHINGDILLRRDTGDSPSLGPGTSAPKSSPADSLWATGIAWTGKHFEDRAPEEGDFSSAIRETRTALRLSQGTQSWWSEAGREIRCTGPALAILQGRRNSRKRLSGQCMTAVVTELPLTKLWLGDTQGNLQKWREYKSIVATITGVRIKDILQIHNVANGVTIFRPALPVLPLTSLMAHWFRMLVLNVIANYPEVVFRQPDPAVMDVHHCLEDRHHVFEASRATEGEIVHFWASGSTVVLWDAANATVGSAVESVLQAPPRTVWITPHPWLSRMLPLWAGKRRWSQSRKKYKRLINSQRYMEAVEARKQIHKKLAKDHEAVAAALRKLDWRTVHRMEKVTSYQTQNIAKLKLNRLRLWNNSEQGYHCLSTQILMWQVVIDQWALAGEHAERGGEEDSLVAEIFGFKISRILYWIVQRGTSNNIAEWDDIYAFVNEMWQLTCAVVLTAIWRRNVDRLHRKERRVPSIEEAQAGVIAQVREAYRRYKGGLYPLTARSVVGMQIADLLLEQWSAVHEVSITVVARRITRVGFFDGGSRGNPGPGGSGSVIVELDPDGDAGTLVWAAATALGRCTTTNNVAEFIGLHRMLEYAAARQWTGLHVVGDSALILRMMKVRKKPKAAKLQHLYRQSRRLADQLEVGSWTHHYRAHNKMADWLANQAMNSKNSTMAAFTAGTDGHVLYKGLLGLLNGDLQTWTSTHTEKATVSATTGAEAGTTAE